MGTLGFIDIMSKKDNSRPIELNYLELILICHVRSFFASSEQRSDLWGTCGIYQYKQEDNSRSIGQAINELNHSPAMISLFTRSWWIILWQPCEKVGRTLGRVELMYAPHCLASSTQRSDVVANPGRSTNFSKIIQEQLGRGYKAWEGGRQCLGCIDAVKRNKRLRKKDMKWRVNLCRVS